MKNQRILGVIGGGFMARAILSGAIGKGMLSAEDIIVSDPDAGSRDYFENLGVAAVSDNRRALACKYLLLAVKPQTFSLVADELKGEHYPIVISIMAGKTKKAISAATGAAQIARVMPNLPCSIGCGMTAVDATMLDADAGHFVLELFHAVGEVIEVEERLLDAVTALSGSGPAYIYLFLKALISAGEAQGLSGAQARTLAFQTMEGGLAMVRSSGKSLDDLIAAVSSRGGTTVAALDSFRSDGFEESVMRAVHAAAERARELSE